MKRLTIFVIILASLWGLFWFGSAFVIKGAVQTWLTSQEKQGWVTEYSDLSVRGFPNRVDLTISDVTLADPQTQMVWKAPFLQSHALVYKPTHQIITFPSSQSISGHNRIWDVTSEGMRASVVGSATGQLLRMKAEAPVLNIDSAQKNFAFANLNAALLIDEDDPQTYRLSATSDAATSSLARLDQLQLDAHISFDRTVRAVVIEGPRPQPTRIVIRLAEYKSEGLEMKIAGSLDLDATGRPSGGLMIKAVNWRDMLAQAIAAGIIPARFAGTVESGLNLLAGLSGNQNTLDLPLTFKDGTMYFSAFPLGPAPRIRF